MGRIIGFLFGLVAYAIFLGTFLYAIGFVSGLAVPKTIDSGPDAPVVQALIINILLMSLFAVQHSVMARPPFKRWWTRFVPVSIERSTYVLLASLVLILLFWLWRPIPQIVWQITDPQIAAAMMALSFAGWRLPGAALQVPPSYEGIAIVTAESVAAAHTLGVEVHVWTINDEAEMEALLDRGVDALMTDFPERAMGVLRRRGVR